MRLNNTLLTIFTNVICAKYFSGNLFMTKSSDNNYCVDDELAVRGGRSFILPTLIKRVGDMRRGSVRGPGRANRRVVRIWIAASCDAGHIVQPSTTTPSEPALPCPVGRPAARRPCDHAGRCGGRPPSIAAARRV